MATQGQKQFYQNVVDTLEQRFTHQCGDTLVSTSTHMFYLVGVNSGFCSDKTSLQCILITKKVNNSFEMAKNANTDFDRMR